MLINMFCIKTVAMFINVKVKSGDLQDPLQASRKVI